MRVRHYDKAFIEDAVALYERSGESARAIAERLGVPAPTLRYWYYDRVGHGKATPKGRRAGDRQPVDADKENPKDKIARLEKELAAAKRQIASLELDREILKKAAAFFVKESE